MAALALATAGLAGAALTPLTGHAAGTTTTLTGQVLRNLNLAQDHGAVDPAGRLAIGVVLANRDQAGADAYAAAAYDAASPLYHHFLTPAEVTARFAPTAATFAAAQQWLTNAGLAVTTVPGSQTYVEASGTAAQVEALTAVQLDNYTFNGNDFYANTTAPQVPTALNIAAIVGLDNFAKPHTMHQAQGAAPSVNVPVTGQLTPQALWSIYDQPANNLGEGQTMAIFGWTSLGDGQGHDTTGTQTISDLRVAEQHWGFPQTPIQYALYGDTTTPDSDQSAAQGEWNLDTQASTDMAPNVQLEKMYFSHHNSDPDILTAFNAWVADPSGPLQGSASFGECENIPQASAVSGTNAQQAGEDAALQQAVLEGRTLFVSTGDTGSSCPVAPVNTNGLATQLYPGIEYPAGSQYAVAVGGTVLGSDGGNPPKRAAEVGWTYSGGGNSCCIAAGSYQANQAKVHCVQDPNGVAYTPPGPPCRSVPDVAAQSGDVGTGNGLTIYSGGSFTQGAGTSLSAPLWNGMWTRVTAAAPPTPTGVYGGLGFANPSFYAIGNTFVPGDTTTRYAHDFFDVVVGNNQPYPATPGYDNVTGWGSPDLANMMLDLDKRTAPANPVAAPVPAQPAAAISCGTLFTHPAGQDNYQVQGQTPPGGGPGTNPQLSITAGSMSLSPDGMTLSTRISISNFSTTVPSGGGENDYNMVWNYNGTAYFTQVAVEPGGVVNYYDGQAVTVSLETKYAQLHVDSGSVKNGPGGYVQVDVPLGNVGNPLLGQVLHQPSAQSYVREGVTNGVLEPADSTSAQFDFLLALSCVTAPVNVPEVPLAPLLLIGGAAAAGCALRRRRGHRPR